MNESLGIDIEVKIQQKASKELPYSVFRKILDSVNTAVFNSEKNNLMLIQKEFPEFPEVAFDAANYRLNKYRYSAILIKELRPGSFIIGGVAAALAIWLLKLTLGETVKEAWLESQGHQKLKEFLLKIMDGKKRSLANDAVKLIQKNVSAKKLTVEYSLDESNKIYINVIIEIDQESFPPSDVNDLI